MIATPDNSIDLADDAIGATFLYQLEIEMPALARPSALHLTCDPNSIESVSNDLSDLLGQLSNRVGGIVREPGGVAPPQEISDI